MLRFWSGFLPFELPAEEAICFKQSKTSTVYLLQYRDAVSKHASRSKYTLSQLMNFDSRFMSEGQFSHKQKSVKRQQHTKEIQDFV